MSDKQAHLPPSQRSVGPDRMGYSPAEQAILEEQKRGDVGKCGACKHGCVVTMSHIRGARVLCELFRMEMHNVVECGRFEAGK